MYIVSNITALFAVPGNFTFDRIGTPYPESVPIAAMRTAPALAGALLIPATYWLLMELGVSRGSAALAGVLIMLGKLS